MGLHSSPICRNDQRHQQFNFEKLVRGLIKTKLSEIIHVLTFFKIYKTNLNNYLPGFSERKWDLLLCGEGEVT